MAIQKDHCQAGIVDANPGAAALRIHRPERLLRAGPMETRAARRRPRSALVAVAGQPEPVSRRNNRNGAHVSSGLGSTARNRTVQG